jgi:hypothetical protein
MNETLMLTLCMEENTLLISNGVLDQLGSPPLIQIRISESDRSLLVQPCAYGTRGAIVVPDRQMYQLETPADTLVRHIRRITGWMDNNPRVLCGVHIPQLNAVYFGLDTAQFAVLQPPPFVFFPAQGGACYKGGAVNG